ncbi:thiamine ABC transporter substrate-binding protein [Halobacteriales archaeon QS_3_64_16]|nr:MAG: thiamine ABC transporter substrate-binding protein [Halobacteriales archaeon QS_3_64_16]
MRRRDFLAGATGGAALLAGCQAEPVDSGANGTGTVGNGNESTTSGENATNGTTVGESDGGQTLRVATYPAYLDAPSVSPGGWVKEQFESTHDATLEWVSPEGGINYFIQRRQQNRSIEADVYLGLTVEELVRGTGGSGSGGGLFAPADTEPIANYDAIKPKLGFDSANRVIPVGTSYVSLVYDETAIEAPSTFADLLEPAYEGALIAENPSQGATGLRFLLQTIAARGEDGYLEYWSELLDNGAQVLGSWSDSYAAYSNGEAPMVISYSTDQVFAERAGEDLSEHQVAFLDNGAVPYTDGIATFEETDKTDLANTFASFMLSPRVQAKTAELNVGLPAVTNATLPNDFQQLVAVPDETIEYSYDRLRGNLQGWVEDWSRQVAGR